MRFMFNHKSFRHAKCFKVYCKKAFMQNECVLLSLSLCVCGCALLSHVSSSDCFVCFSSDIELN